MAYDDEFEEQEQQAQPLDPNIRKQLREAEKARKELDALRLELETQKRETHPSATFSRMLTREKQTLRQSAKRLVSTVFSMPPARKNRQMTLNSKPSVLSRTLTPLLTSSRLPSRCLVPR